MAPIAEAALITQAESGSVAEDHSDAGADPNVATLRDVGFEDEGSATLLDRTALAPPSPLSAGDGTAESASDCERTPPRVAAYYSRRRAPFGPKAEAALWERNPGTAALAFPVEGFQHQVLPWRASPHPTEGSQKRWPEVGGSTGDGQAPWSRFNQEKDLAKRDWTSATSVGRVCEEGLQVTLHEIVSLLTQRYGNLRIAFDKIDINLSGSLSLMEWQDGLYNLFSHATGKHAAEYKALTEPRWMFFAHCQRIFRSLDVDGDGVISFEELAKPRPEAGETALRFQRRLAAQKKPENEKAKLGQSASAPTLAELEACWQQASGPSKLKAVTEVSTSELMRSVAAVLLSKFRTPEEAFVFMDASRNGSLSMAEFVAGLRDLRLSVSLKDAKALFNELGGDKRGALEAEDFAVLQGLPPPNIPVTETILVKTDRDVVAERQRRSPIRGPGQLRRGACFAGLDMQLPMGEKVSSSAGFFSFPRSATGRLDLRRHPEELPGVDRANFTPDHGPGCHERGPGFFPEVGCASHPLRGNGWKVGAVPRRLERFSPEIPSKEGRADEACLAAVFSSYPGRRPEDGWQVCGTGGASLAQRAGRLAPTFGTADSFGLLGPKPIGPWQESRASLTLRSHSTPSLLRLPM